MVNKKDLIVQQKRDCAQRKRDRRERLAQDKPPGNETFVVPVPLAAAPVKEPDFQVGPLAESGDLLVADKLRLVGISLDEYYQQLFDPNTRGPGWWDEVLVFGKDDLASIKIDDVIFIDPNDAIADENQPRKFFDQNLLWQLSHSIAVCRQQEIAQVYFNPDKDDVDHPFVILNGERRWRATKQAYLPYRVQVVSAPSAELERLMAQVTSNENREGLSDLEIAWNIADLRKHGMSVGQIMLLYGKSDAWVYQHLSALELVPEVQQMISPQNPEEKRLSLFTAIRLKDLPKEKQYETAQQILGRSGFEAREIIRGVANQTEKPLSGRSRHGSDDLDIFRNLLNNYLARLAYVAEYPDERFGKMFLSLPPKTFIEHSKLLSLVIAKTREIKARMYGFMPKGVNVKTKPDVSIDDHQESPQSVPSIPMPNLLGELEEVLEKTGEYFHSFTSDSSIFSQDISLEKAEALRQKAEDTAMAIARLRLSLDKKIGKKSPTLVQAVQIDCGQEEKPKPSTSLRRRFKHLLSELLDMTTENDQELAEKFGSSFMEVSGLSSAIEDAIERLKKMMHACNRVSHGRM